MTDQLITEFSREAMKVAKGTVLMRQGEVGNSAYFVIEGRLLVEQEVNGCFHPVAEIGAKDIVGELAILDDAPRSATVTAIENSLIL